MVRRIVDLLLIFAILGAVGFGAYELGQTTYHRANPKGPSRHTWELVGGAIAGVAGVMIVVSFGSALLRTRKRQRWHAT
ncbi:MAG TPA: hypothetical protein VNR59_10710 [Gaiellaceae bacterium]|nr:hypothetical protein [Gaiellaceae bacterium]